LHEYSFVCHRNKKSTLTKPIFLYILRKILGILRKVLNLTIFMKWWVLKLVKILKTNRILQMKEISAIAIIFVVLAVWASSWEQELVVLGGNAPLDGLYAFGDSTDHGTSKVLEQVYKDGILRYSFEHGAGFAFPYVGGGFSVGIDSCTFDASIYDALRIDWYGENVEYARIGFLTYDPDHTKLADPISYRLSSVEIPVPEVSAPQEYSLSKLAVPQWWRELHGVSASSTQLYLDKTCRIEWVIPATANSLRKGVLRVRKISLVRSDSSYMMAFIIIGSLIVVVLFIVRLQQLRKERERQLEARHKARLRETLNELPEEEELPEGDWDKVRRYMLENYRNPEINSEGAARFLGMSGEKISQLIKDNTGHTFKPFLNELRVEKAKELLRLTEEQITAIADSTGFNNTSHFNRVFKMRTGQTPSEYRKEQKQ
jgi:AraC-like DNA-binding protein